MNLDKPYHRDTCLNFLDAFVPGFKQDIRKAEADKLQVTEEAHYLGESEELDLAVFELTHTSSSDARVSLSMDGFKLMKSSATYRALIIYRSANSDDWRFSLMTATPDLDEKGKVVRKLSNPRRFSFFLGPNAKINTPYQYLIKQGAVSDFEDLQKRFSLEVVNKVFYKQISEKFTQLVGGTLGTGKKQKTYEPLIKLPSQSPESQINMEFGVRLIGRIIFCWFLREKKSAENVSLMPRDLLSFEAVSKHKDYYHGVLEPIFFEVLNKEQRSRKEEFSGEPYSLIPYLNGGLFSPREDDYYKRPNGVQSIYHNTLVVPDEWLKDLFEILETYNFTIDENTSFDEELSIDPEMLGRIFENLLAEINPETGESARKSTGSYYTPRLIVDYMVDESILLYLQEHTKIAEEKLRAIISYDLSDDEEHPLTDGEKKQIVEHLSKLKLLDPACGSGAFPIGALQKIVFVLQQIDAEGKFWLQKQLENAHPEFRKDIEKKFSNNELDFLRKLGIIRECIFGVDIQPIATEIARLRCFLTLIVDERIDDASENRGIKPLPNLDFKFVTANSLIDLPKIEELSDQTQMFDDREKINELKSVRDQYFNAYSLEREQLKTEFVMRQKRLINDLLDEHDFMGLEKAILTSKLTSWEPFTHKSSPWFDPEWMFGISDGFDIVIANPPYIGERGHKEIFRKTKEESSLGKFYQGKMDLYYFFLHLSLNLINTNGIIVFITTNSYLKARGAIKLRKDIHSRANICKLINFNELKIFSSADNFTMITLLKKGVRNKFVHLIDTKNNGYVSNGVIRTILDGTDANTFYNIRSVDDLFSGEDFYISTSVIEESEPIFKKILRDSEPLGKIYDVNAGIQTGADTVTRKHISDYNVDASSGEGIFILSEKEVGQLNLSNESLVNLKPWFSNSDIHRWSPSFSSNEKVIYMDRTQKNITEQLKQHLSRFKIILDQRREVVNRTIEWWKLQWPRDEQVFIGPKIVTCKWIKKNDFAYCEIPWFASVNISYITNKPNSESGSLKYLLSLLNSKVFYFWLYHKGKRAGDRLMLDPKPLFEIPIRQLTPAGQQPFIEIVDKILIITQSENYSADYEMQAQIKRYEEQIDKMVYELYELTPEEIEIVESFSK